MIPADLMDLPRATVQLTVLVTAEPTADGHAARQRYSTGWARAPRARKGVQDVVEEKKDSGKLAKARGSGDLPQLFSALKSTRAVFVTRVSRSSFQKGGD